MRSFIYIIGLMLVSCITHAQNNLMSPPQNLFGQSELIMPDGIYYFGGMRVEDGQVIANNVMWVLDNDNQWHVANRGDCLIGPAPRGYAHFYSVNGEIYIEGGVTETNECVSDKWKYNWTTRCWDYEGVSYQIPCKKNFAFGPMKASTWYFAYGGESTDGMAHASFYKIASGSQGPVYVNLNNHPEAKTGAAIFLVDGTKPVTFGGINYDIDPNTPGNQVSASNKSFVFFENINAWYPLTTMGNIPELYDMAYTQTPDGHTMFVIGGNSWDYNTNTPVPSSGIYFNSVNNHQWISAMTSLPDPSTGLLSSYKPHDRGNDTIIIVGGRKANGQPVGMNYKYAVNSQTLTPFPHPTYALTATAGQGGSINPGGTHQVYQGSNITFSINPDPGFAVAAVLVNGQNIGQVNQYTIEDIQAPQSIEAQFSQLTYSITATAGPGGSIQPSGQITVPWGGSQTFSIQPDQGYAIAAVLVDGQNVGPVATYTFSNVQAPHSIEAQFSQLTYNITATAGPGGSIQPSGQITVPWGESQTFSIQPDQGYAIAAVLVDGQNVGPVATYTFSNVQAPHSIEAQFSQLTYNITASAGPGGSIQPSGQITVPWGGSQTFSIQPDQGYSIAAVLVDGQNVGPVATYTFSNVQAPHSIEAQFSQLTFSITASAGPGGSIQPSGQITVPWGGSQTFSIQPDQGYAIAAVLVDGQNVGPVATYTFSNVQAPHSIEAQFSQLTYNITASAGPGGSIQPSGQITVPWGGSQTFSIQPDQGYAIAAVLVDGQNVGPMATYTFSNVQAPHSIEAQFSQLTYSITATAGPGGSIQPSGQITVPWGGSQTFSIQPDQGYAIAAVLVDGQNVGPVATYTFSNVQAPHSIEAQFSQLTYSITATAGPGGSIQPSGQITVPWGGSQTFFMSPDPGYKLDSVLVDNSFVGTMSNYTFANVTSNHLIRAVFGLITGNHAITTHLIRIIPNPADGPVEVFLKDCAFFTWKLIDLRGIMLNNGLIDTNEEQSIKLNLPNGIYFFVIEDGQHSYAYKLIKQ